MQACAHQCKSSQRSRIPQGLNLQVVVNLPVRVLGIRCNSLTNSSPLSHLSRPRFPFLNWQLRVGEFQSTHILKKSCAWDLAGMQGVKRKWPIRVLLIRETQDLKTM